MKRHLFLMAIFGGVSLTALHGQSGTNDILLGGGGDPPWHSVQVPDPSRIDNCVVLPARDVDVPARVNGPMAELLVEAGDTVTAGHLLGRMESRRHEAIRDAAEQRHREALQLANCDAALREARAAADVADLHYQARLEANERRAGMVSHNEMLNYRLEAIRARHMVAQAESDHARNALSAAARKAEFMAAGIDHEDCQITAPYDGIVVQTNVVAGEWVTAGNTVVRVVTLDSLLVQGILSPRFPGADMLTGRQVSVSFLDSAGQPASLSAIVSFVSPLVHANGGRQLRVKVQNKRIDGHWTLNPGVAATIHLDSGGPALPMAMATAR